MEIDYCEDQLKSPSTDIAMVTQLLQEKERDLELAARIGQTLLIRNKSVTHQNELLEDKLSQALEEASQLRHEISLKDDLLHIYADNETDSSGAPSPGREVKIFGRSQLQSQVESLHEKIKRLEQDNADLLEEQSSIQSEELQVEEQAQVANTVKQLHILQKELEIANNQIQAVTDELAKRSDEAMKQQKEISSLITQIVSLQNKHKDLALEHEELQEHLSFANRSQFELSKEVQNLEDRYQEVLSVIEETREHNSLQTSSFDSHSLECTQDSQVPFQHSLAAELENSGIEFNLLPPSASSSAQEDRDEPSSNSSPVEPSNSNLLLGKPGQPGTQDLNAAIVKLSTKKSSPSLKTIQTSGIVQRYNSKIVTKSPGMRKISTAPKLRIVKPLEGSTTLHQWKNLAERCMSFLPTKDEMVSSAGILIRGACIRQEAKKGSHVRSDQPKKCRFVIGDQEELIQEPIFIGSEDAFESFCPTASSSLPKSSYMNNASYKFGSHKLKSPTIIKPKPVIRPKFSDNLQSTWKLEKHVLLKGSQSSPDFKILPSSTSNETRRKNNIGEFDQLHGSHKLLAQQNRPTSLRCNFFHQDSQSQSKTKKGCVRQMSTPRR